MTRTEMLAQCGFEKDMTAVVIAELNKKTTKANTEVLDKIDRSEFYKVIVSESQFTIFTSVVVFKYEIKKIESILNLKHRKASSIIDGAGLWDEWVAKDLQD